MDNRPIGIFDSGVGGLSVLKELIEALPGESFLYLGDTARAPYGVKDAETINRYADECAAFLWRFGVKGLVVACNTASALALSRLISIMPCPVIGMVEPLAKAAINSSKTKKIGIIGTMATINSQAFEEEIAKIDPEIKVLSIACPLFVPLVEEGIFEGEIVQLVCERYLRPFKNAEIDTLILGCTHYPLIYSEIQRYLGAEINIIDSSAIVKMGLDTLMAVKSTSYMSPPTSRFFVTDGAQRFNQIAKHFLGGGEISSELVTLKN